MSRPQTLLTALLVPLTLGAFGPDVTMKASDHKKLAKQVAGWFEAKEKTKDIGKSFLAVSEAVDKLEKKMDGKSALALIDDWREVLYLARLGGLENDIKARKGKAAELSVEMPNKSELEFALSVPGSYNPKKGPYPLFVIVGEAGSTPLELLESEYTEASLRDGALLLAPKMPAEVAEWTVLESQGGGIATIMSLYGKSLGSLPIDMDRVYLVGHGAGAGAAAKVADLYPQLFAGLVVVDAKEPIIATNFRNLPTLSVGSGAGSTGLSEAIGALGYDNNTAAEAFAAAELWSWSEDKERDAYPLQLTFSPGHPYTTSAHWISLQGVDIEAGPRVEARVDKDANAIIIDAQKVTALEISFNDALVDLDKPVDVVINGKSHPTSVSRNMRTMLELNYSGGDWGRIFTSRVPFDVPTGEGDE